MHVFYPTSGANASTSAAWRRGGAQMTPCAAVSRRPVEKSIGTPRESVTVHPASDATNAPAA
jgi:hypothetical protein